MDYIVNLQDKNNVRYYIVDSVDKEDIMIWETWKVEARNKLDEWRKE